jgi:hypothetical protein
VLEISCSSRGVAASFRASEPERIGESDKRSAYYRDLVEDWACKVDEVRAFQPAITQRPPGRCTPFEALGSFG